MKTRIWSARLLVLIVFFININCAFSFIFSPQDYIASYELAGAPGLAALQGIGVTFLMWNATYPPVIIHPDRHRVLFIVVLAQQVIGLIGESIILLTLPEGHELLVESIMRFIAFDAGGLILLLAAFFLSRRSKENHA